MESASRVSSHPFFGRSAGPGSALLSAQTEALGTNIFHEEAGKGRPLVLLHGLNDTHRTWRAVLPELVRTRRVLVPDLPGCGLSGRPDATYALDWQASVINAWLGALGLEEVDVVGHSYGGGVALQMLLLRPKRIRRLALVAAGGLGREVTFELRLASLPRLVERFGQPFMVPLGARALRAGGGVVGTAEEAWLRGVNSRPGTARAFARTVRDVIDWRGQTRHFLDRAREIKQFPPVALFWGSEDPVIPHAQAITTLQILRGAELTTLAGCGHFPHQQRPAEFVRELTTFLDTRHARPVRCVVPEPRLRFATRVMEAMRKALHPSQQQKLPG
jgi:pimeloyl-ACP methyl ester carboxylesterase